MTDPAARDRQLETMQHALALGVDWFDTAATYGNGTSETNLGWALRELGASSSVRIGTKVRLATEQLDDIPGAVRASVEGSLTRLGVNSVALLQLHNSITRQRGDQPTSITPDDVLRSDGVLAAFEQLRREGLVQHFGLTGLGDTESLEEVLRTEAWATMQVNLNLCAVGRDSVEPHSERSEASGASFYIATPDQDARSARADSVGKQDSTESRPTSPAFLAIRVFAGGALAGRPPSAHTLTTKFFPLPGYERDLRRAEAMRKLLTASQPGNWSAGQCSAGNSRATLAEQCSALLISDAMPTTLPEAAVRFAVHHARVTSAIIGFGSPEEVADAARWAANGPLPDELVATLTRAGV